MKAVQLLVVDDHTLFRRGLVALLSTDGRFSVVGQAGDVNEALRVLERVTPDLILLDNHLPGVRGIEGIAALKSACPNTRILMLTVSESEDDLAAAMHAGADGYLLKTVETEHLCESITKVLAGDSVISPEMMTKFVAIFRSRGMLTAAPGSLVPAALAQEPQRPQGLDALSGREREILQLIARGDSNKLIARQLDIAEATVKIHVQHILRKLQLSSRVQAAVFAASNGLG